MIWHIFKKDCRLLWPLIAIVASAHAVSAVLWVILGRFGEPRQLLLMGQLFPLVGMLGMVILTVAMVHQDVVPGTRQDWLVRPIERPDLIWAKLLFLLLMVQGPLCVVDFTEALCDGFTVQAALDAALSKGIVTLCLIGLPALALGAVTQTTTQALIGGIATLLSGMMVVLIVQAFRGTPGPLAESGLVWMAILAWMIIAAVGGTLILTLQYARRRTPQARYLTAGIATVALCVLYVPWKPLFAIEQRIAPHPGAGAPISLAFDPSLPRINSSHRSNALAVYLPLRVEGLSPDSILLTDRAEIRIASLDGDTLYQGASHLSIDGNGSIPEARLEVRQAQRSNNALRVHQTIFLPYKYYARLKDQPVQLTVDYSLTLLRPDVTSVMPALAGDRRLPGAGWCATKTDGDDDGVVLSCLSTEESPWCFTAFLEHTVSGRRNPEYHRCVPWYEPHAANLWPSVLTRFGGELPFKDRSGLAQYPIDETQLAESRVVLETYEAQDHFTRRLVIPQIRLTDLTSTSSGA